MATLARLLRTSSTIIISCLLASCVGLGVTAPYTVHKQQTAADKQALPGLIHRRDEIIDRHDQQSISTARLTSGIERISVKTGRTSCGVLLLVLPIFPPVCPTRIQYDLENDIVIATHERKTRFYGFACSVVFPMMGNKGFCAMFPISDGTD